MGSRATLLWFRNDLRLSDNPAIEAAVLRAAPIIPVFIWAPQEEQLGSASRWWLHHSLKSLSADLESCQSRLVIRSGCSFEQLTALLDETGADAIYWNKRYEPAVWDRDQDIQAALSKRLTATETYNSALLFEPWEIQTQQQKSYQVFTPFWKSCLSHQPPGQPVSAPAVLQPPDSWPVSLSLDDLQLQPRINWANGFIEYWQPGEAGAQQKLQQFLQSAIKDYQTDRNRPDLIGTSRLSPHLHFGEISPRQIWHAVADSFKLDWNSTKRGDAETFLSEIGWREFAYHVLYHHRDTPNTPLKKAFESFPWKQDDESLQAWQRGQTGYPIVDAGMRELWQSGWMHNRVRMIVGSFLTKDLLIHWKEGADWFWDTLVDADLANNTLGWQWISGCGADAAPYFRIFNPVTQGEKFDPAGSYVRKWVPELQKLPDRWLHKPWNAPPEILASADVVLGANYPHPIVDHKQARGQALDALATIKK